MDTREIFNVYFPGLIMFTVFTFANELLKKTSVFLFFRDNVVNNPMACSNYSNYLRIYKRTQI